MAPTHVTVTAPEGRLTPVHARDGIQPGGAQMVVEPGYVDRVAYSGVTQRSINRGDLVLCDLNGAPVASAELAAAPNELPGGRIAVGSFTKRDLAADRPSASTRPVSKDGRP